MGSEESLLAEVHFIEKHGSQNTAEIYRLKGEGLSWKEVYLWS